MTNAVDNVTQQKIADAERAARSLESIASLLKSDEVFVAAMKVDPRGALAAAGLTLEKEAMEALLVVDPKRFDDACEELFSVADSDFLIEMSSPSCG